MTTRESLLATITVHYLGGSFNGFPLREIRLDREDLVPLVAELIEDGLISLNFGNRHPNPHIKALPPESTEVQLRQLADATDLTHVTAYPEEPHLAAVVDPDQYAGQPYTLRLALGMPELVPIFFDVSVLEPYRNDPRYYYDTDDVQGRIAVTDDYFRSEDMRESDRILLETFGFGYDDDLDRAVCSFPVYLSRLSPEHQQIWAAKELSGPYWMHPAYAASTAGHWPDRVSIFRAFTEELAQLQKMCEAIGLPPIVRDNFQANKPANFGFLLRPTLKELQDFHGTLDKLMSENLNKRFFVESGLSVEREIERKDGRIEVQQKGTIALLEEWTDQIHFPDSEPRDTMLNVFREVRRLRQRPAHAADDNRFDSAYATEQRQLVLRAYSGVRTLRLILANHPGLADFEVPGWLYRGEIYPF